MSVQCTVMVLESFKFEKFVQYSACYKAGRTPDDFSPPIFVNRQKLLRVRDQFLRDFSRPFEIGQYQTVLIIHRHVNRLKSAD